MESSSESPIQEDILSKQTLIKKEIIDKNYDKNLFFDYCLSSKPQHGDNLNNWTISDLNEVITNFITEQNKIKEELLQKEQIKLSNQAKTENIKLNMEQIQSNKAEEYHSSPYIKEIKCKVLEKSILNDKQISITVQNPKHIENGFFSSNYIVYEVKTMPVNWGVTRRYSDFLWLRATLCKIYPRFFVPPIPPKKIGARRFEMDFVEKRMNFLNKFLNTLVENENFKASEPLCAFLSMNDRAQFESKMKELSTFFPSKFVEDIKTINGKIYLSDDFDSKNEMYFTNISNFFKLQNQLFERLNYNLKNFYTYMSAVCVHLEEVQKDFELLHLLNSKVQMKDEITRSYEELGFFFKNWKRMLFNQNEVIKHSIKDFFKYTQMEGSAFEELIKSREDIKKQYTTEETKLNAKKDKLWIAQDLSKWEITEDPNKIDRMLLFRDKLYACSKMCTAETNSLNTLKKQLSYANKSNVDELKNLIGKYCLSYIVNIKQFCEKMYPSMNDGLRIWTGLATYADVY